MVTSGIGSAFDLMAARMDYLKQRHAVIAQNVANADSPDYKAKDLVDFNKAVQGATGVRPVHMALTNQKHISVDGKGGADFAEDSKSASYETLPSGNNVVLEEQMMKVAEISSDYQLITNLYKRSQNLVRTALGRV